jgi:microcystin-dependent protein
VFNTVVDKTAVTAQTASTLTNAIDWINLYDNTGSFTLIGVQSKGVPAVENLVKIERNALLADLRASLMPTGVVIPFAGIDIPDGWLVCAGQPVARVDYPALYAVLKNHYSLPSDINGGNEFRLPDLRGRIPVGFSDMPGDIVPIPTPGFNNLNTLIDDKSSGYNAVGGLSSSTAVSTATTATSIYMGLNYIIKAV